MMTKDPETLALIDETLEMCDEDGTDEQIMAAVRVVLGMMVEGELINPGEKDEVLASAASRLRWRRAKEDRDQARGVEL